MVFALTQPCPPSWARRLDPEPDPGLAQIVHAVVTGQPVPTYGAWQLEPDPLRARRLWFLREASSVATAARTALATAHGYDRLLKLASTFPPQEAQALQVVVRLVQGHWLGRLYAEKYDWVAKTAPQVGGEELLRLLDGIERRDPEEMNV